MNNSQILLCMVHPLQTVATRKDIVNLVLSGATKRHGAISTDVGICLSKEILKSLSANTIPISS